MKLYFEVTEEVGEKIRRVDMVVEDEILGNIFYEFKSVKDVPPANFLEQFGKDFRNTAWPAENGGLTMLNRVHHL